MDVLIKDALQTNEFTRMGCGGGGCINEGEGYYTDKGPVFVKRNKDPRSRIMFEGELAGLNAILATRTVRAPKPHAVIDNPKGGSALIMEFLEMSHLSRHSKELGERLACMHLHNEQLDSKLEKDSGRVGTTAEEDPAYVTQFGFDTTTCCGFLPLNNSWCDDWVQFYATNRLEEQVKMTETKHGDREARQLWNQLQLILPKFYKDIEVKPALLHGDLWGGNVAEIASEPVVFDCATFYGHSEFELGIAGMFGGFSAAFYKAYHNVIPKATGFEARKDLYQLFHYLNHWNHFGGSYRGSSISIMKRLIKNAP